MPAYEEILNLTANDCVRNWRDVCDTIAALPCAFTLHHVYCLIKHLADIGSWQAWVIAGQVYKNFTSRGILDHQPFNTLIGAQILVIVHRAIFSDNQTIVTNSVIIYAGIYFRMLMHKPIPPRERDIIRSVYERLRPSFQQEKDELGFFLRIAESRDRS